MQEPKPDLGTGPAAASLIGSSDAQWRGAPSYTSFSEQRISALFLSNRKTSAGWPTK